MAWTHAQVVLRQINAREADAQLYGRLANSILYAHASLRADSSVLMRNRRGQSGLWGYAISGDLPIVLLRIGELANIELVRQLIQAHAYWRLKGLAVDLVIWNEDRAGYRQVLQEQILALVAVGLETQAMDRPGGIFVRSAEQISEEDRTLFQTVARVILSDGRGSLAEQVNRPASSPGSRTGLRPQPAPTGPGVRRRHRAPRRDLILFNGIGGFTADGREYVITTTPGADHARAMGERARQSRTSAASSRRAARPIPGARTPTSSVSRPGTTTRSATRAARRSICATRRAASSGRPRRCPGAAPRRT